MFTLPKSNKEYNRYIPPTRAQWALVAGRYLASGCGKRLSVTDCLSGAGQQMVATQVAR